MKIVQPNIEFLGEVPTDYAGNLKFIEAAGRVCYKSEDKITEDSAEKFVGRTLIPRGHLAMVEHSSFVVRARCEVDLSAQEFEALDIGKFLTKHEDRNFYYVGGNLTAWWNYAKRSGIDAASVPFVCAYHHLFGIPTDLVAYLSPWQVCPHNEIPQELHRYAVKFTTDRGVSHELVRHRPPAIDWFSKHLDFYNLYRPVTASFAQESTRYCNYGSGKFGKEISVIEPQGLTPEQKRIWEHSCGAAEASYLLLLNYGATPQQARSVLPTCTKTELVITADLAEWRHIFKLRCAPEAHPDCRNVALMARAAFVGAGLLENC